MTMAAYFPSSLYIWPSRCPTLLTICLQQVIVVLCQPLVWVWKIRKKHLRGEYVTSVFNLIAERWKPTAIQGKSHHTL